MAAVLPTPTILLFGTFDTKLAPLLRLHQFLLSQHPQPKILVADVSCCTAISHPIISLPYLNGCYDPLGNRPEKDNKRQPLDMTPVVFHFTTQLQSLYKTQQIHACISLGGSCGTSLASQAMKKALPLGVPKVIVSTMASGDTRPYLEDSDIVLIPSIVDVAGENTVLDMVLRNAAGAVNGMAWAATAAAAAGRQGSQGPQEPLLPPKEKRRVAVTMFGITTPAVEEARQVLEATGCEVLIFHANGSGGRCMERLIRSGLISGVLDLTTTELVDEICGGVLSAGSNRLLGAVQMGVPQVVSTGAGDCINFGPSATLPERYINNGRTWWIHNEAVTVVRTNKEECGKLGKLMAERLKGAKDGRLAVIVPTRGMSKIGEKTDVFYDAESDMEVVRGMREGGLKVEMRDMAINDKGFGRECAERLISMMDACEASEASEASGA
jgi:uncharacterized protein (UPF0261 family)